MSKTGFLRPYHDKSRITAPRSVTNSVFDPADVPAISAYISASGIDFAQLGRETAKYAYVPEYSAEIVPPNGVTATGYSHHCLVAKRGLPDAHLMAYPGEAILQNVISGQMIPTAP
jgi:hypothetical protein